MDYTDFIIKVPRGYSEDVSSFAASLTSVGIYLEDNADVEKEIGKSVAYDYIDESLLHNEGSDVLIHMYPSSAKEEKFFRDRIIEFCDMYNISVEIATQKKCQEDWENSWKDNVATVVTGSYEVLPEWKERSDLSKTPLYIDTTEAYGSGQSINTQLCLEAVSDLNCDGHKVLDMGTGTGILAIAALLQGAKEAIGIDVEQTAIENAQMNAEKNGVEERFQSLLRSKEALESHENEFDFLFAHITADVILQDRHLYRKLLKRNGVFLGGGILKNRKAEVVSGLDEAGFHDFHFYEREEWVTLICKKG
ncbi:MAG: 50S ribosomal protein L11 methyltransferase [Oscillospiraceae bacterium]|nr:50S ribosomal protein L11 methyltransferase [Oscillospiraceae bacterium]